MDKMIRVLVTGVGGGGFGEQLLKALRMAATPYYIVGVDMSPISIGLFDVDEGYTIPPAADDKYIDALLRICKNSKVRVLIPGSEPELKKVLEFRELFIKIGVLPLINSKDVIEICSDKWRTVEFLKSKGFSIPKSFIIKSKEDIEKIDIFPLVVKPVVGGGSQNIFIVQDEEELNFFCNYLLKEGHILLIQEYIGKPDEEYTVGVLSGLSGNIINSIAIRRYILSGLSNKIKVRNRTGRDELSPILAISSGISQGSIEEYKDIRDQCEQIALALRSKGPLNIQCRFVDGKVFPFEINPRFSGTTSLRALVGFNEPDILIRKYLLKEEISQHFVYSKGYVVRGLSEKYIPIEEIKKEYR
jgi:carbamoyl-phosphate synthase large subunit